MSDMTVREFAENLWENAYGDEELTVDWAEVLIDEYGFDFKPEELVAEYDAIRLA